MAKVYAKGNYLFLEIPGNVDPLIDGKSKVLIFPVDESADDYTIKSELIGNRTFNLSELEDESGTPYNQATWDEFYLNNSGFNSASGGSGADGEAETRTGTNLVFDNSFGAYYNAASPSSAASVVLDSANRKTGSPAVFVSDGMVEVTSTPDTVIKGGVYKSGQVNEYWYVWNGSQYNQNIFNGVDLPQLPTPSVVFTPGDGDGDYLLSESPSATGGNLMISDDNISFTPVAGWTFGTNSGTITGLTNGTEYFIRYQITASGFSHSDYATDSGTPSSATILFQDDFAGSTIDVLKWDLTNPNTPNIDISQNNELFIDVDGTVNTNVGDNNIRSVDNFDLASTKVFSFDVYSDNQDFDVGFFHGILNKSDSAGNQISLFYGANPGEIRYWVKQGGVDLIGLSTLSIDLTSYKTFKILVTPTTTSLHYWNGASWTQFDTVANTWSQGMALSFDSGNKSSEPATVNKVDNVFVSNVDFSTQYPV